MSGHFFPEGSDFFGEIVVSFSCQAIGPEHECFASGLVKSLPFFWFQLMRLSDWRKLRGVQDLVGVCIADTTEDAGIGERA